MNGWKGMAWCSGGHIVFLTWFAYTVGKVKAREGLELSQLKKSPVWGILLLGSRYIDEFRRTPVSQLEVLKLILIFVMCLIVFHQKFICSGPNLQCHRMLPHLEIVTEDLIRYDKVIQRRYALLIFINQKFGHRHTHRDKVIWRWRQSLGRCF